MPEQLRPEQIILNGGQLLQRELDQLLDCDVPPKDLIPAWEILDGSKPRHSFSCC
ncbi:hypothetical protein M569_16999 [Genlisea aurea]|uniref:Uncharacterized protein n=1 Tax=Genlisea aurea TaxID=192259 RepID=S8BTV4_9LAMI|nr:hypothetical protein M569_16999 [Genlisea aurea]